ncbi:hypothetical protein ACN42_g10939 [Penicillium freii]|uniref:Uncharacterized protein n=1 Tax=Penicillium freii TaxID=48697 RepID=A0A101M9F6_PENFR|nr:hypothetical protein ACN42_g10939 [Penicillium freii]
MEGKDTSAAEWPEEQGGKRDFSKDKKTYNSEDSLVVTHPTTNSPACGLSTAERTGSPVFHTLWSYVSFYVLKGMIELNLRWA